MKFCLTNFELFKRMSEKLSQDPKSSQSTKVRVMQNCENSADGSIPIIVNQNVNEDSNLSHHSALIPVNNFEERSIAEEIGAQEQIEAYRSINNILRSWEYIQERIRANSSTFANSRSSRSSRRRSRNRRRNRGQHQLFRSMNKTKKTLKLIKSLLMQNIDVAFLNNYD